MTTSTCIAQIVASRFNRKTIRALAKKGITIIDTTWLPDEKGDFTKGCSGYVLNDNGTQRVRMYLDVLAMAR